MKTPETKKTFSKANYQYEIKPPERSSSYSRLSPRLMKLFEAEIKTIHWADNQ